MKNYLFVVSLVFGVFNAHSQTTLTPSAKKSEVFYELAEEARGFSSITDTLKATAEVLLAKGTRVFVTSYPTPHWAVCTRGNSRYIIPVAALGTYEIPDNTTSGSNAGSSNTSGLYTGPRGGVYRINSKGGKTYIKH